MLKKAIIRLITVAIFEMMMVRCTHALTAHKSLKDSSQKSVDPPTDSSWKGYKQFFDESIKQKFLSRENSDDINSHEDKLYSKRYQQEPVCPLKIETIIKQEVVEELIHTIATLRDSSEWTKWETKTETSYFPITLMNRHTTTINVDPLYITETRVLPSTQIMTRAKLVTSETFVTTTELDVTTYIATNTITRTEVKPLWITLTEIATHWITSTSPVVTTVTEWLSKVEDVTQPIYITTSFLVEAPELLLVTSTEVQPHYKTTTEFVTEVVYHTVCTEQ